MWDTFAKIFNFSGRRLGVDTPTMIKTCTYAMRLEFSLTSIIYIHMHIV